ncbi:MAG: Maf family protein [Thermodesulfovibrionales bacterium]
MPEQRRIVLASASPRRKEILAKTGLCFEIDRSGFDEQLDPGVEPHRLARTLARHKAQAVSSRYEDALIIAADTFIAFHGQMLGKPHTPPEARRMLALLSGRTHSVITGYAVIDTRTGKLASGSEETQVVFRRLSKAEISAYVKTGEPLDKAGAYAIQGIGAMLVQRIDGDYLNVVGLPLVPLLRTLGKFGVRVLR